LHGQTKGDVVVGHVIGMQNFSQRIILKSSLKKYDVKIWTGLMWLSLGPTVKMIMNLHVP
jgi:hypothetical protein